MTIERSIPLRALVPFLGLTFGLTWGLAALLWLFPARVEAVFGPVGYTNPLFVLAVYAPAFAALALVWRYGGTRAIGSFLRRLTLWRMPVGWWGFLVIGIPAVFFSGAALKGSLGAALELAPGYGILPALGAALLIGPIEELGWRGLALPLLQRRLTPFWAGLTLGVVWAVWHAPAFLVRGTPQSAWSFPAFFLGVVALSVIMTPMFNEARGSLLVPALFHFQTNGPAWPDAQPWDAPLFAAVALFVVWLRRTDMFTPGAGATRVLLPAERDRRSSSSPVAEPGSPD